MRVENFQFPLSGSLDEAHNVDEAGLLYSFQFPLSGSLEWDVSRLKIAVYDVVFFQFPLSGSLPFYESVVEKQEKPFNSLSRDHDEVRDVVKNSAEERLSIPSLGIT